ncbi:MAG: thioredoxin domain-containing protein, partial [Verrucomicrobia bacterium]|nr:thioredoxin domain-containing protein [Verrucomicrobiota bacterium]
MDRVNRLAGEKSPYLLQHARNPVDWRPWGAEAFEAARAGDKPIFLSIGYSTCHWCHVMERESFEDAPIARFLNDHFVSIKVDREERPDVDRLYMTFVQGTTGGGGWPMSVFLTPDLKPFYGGTYFPPDARQGRPGFRQLLEHVARLWGERRAELLHSAADIHASLAAMAAPAKEGAAADETVLKNALEFFKGQYDARHGGFGGAPKFPQPAAPALLLRCAARFGDAEAARMVLHTCERMAAGGIHDQLGGGFARYSVDARWLAPHFEKMLYDNAQLARLYLDAFLAARGMPGGAERASGFAATARDILDYVLRDMTHPEGGFFSAEDADSEGHEGKFYCWTRDELAQLLAPEEFEAAVKFFGVTAQGNFMDHSHPQPLQGLNVLSAAGGAGGNEAALAAAKGKMLAARNRRVRPQRDDKVLASWNGLMLGAFARAAAVLADDRYRAAAERNARFIRERLWSALPRAFYHRWRDGERDEAQLAEGYAFYLAGLIELYETTLDPGHLQFATELAVALLEKFFDPGRGGFWQSDAADLIVRLKDDYDGATPSGNSAATLALLKLGAITGEKRFTEAAARTLAFFAR